MPGTSSPVLTFADSPRKFPGLAFWYRADFVTLVGLNASVISDQSGNGLDALQAVDANRFVWSQTSGPNGTPGLTGTGTQNAVTSGSLNLSAATQLDIFVIWRPVAASAAGGDAIINNDVNDVSQGQFNDLYFGGGTDLHEAVHFNAGPTLTSSTAAAATAGAAVIIEYQHDQTVATNQTNVLKNGVLGAQTRVSNQNVTGGFGNLPLRIGKNVNIPAQGLKGVWAEMIGYSRLLNAVEKSDLLRGYLGLRYAIVVP